ncbi:MAG: VanW family protein [Eubacteriales bacterium]|nr:VanW family protein [Eubacteriales bacterium]
MPLVHQDHEQQRSDVPDPSPSHFWFALSLSILGVLLLGGTIFAILTYQAGVREAIRVSESIAYEDYLQKKAALDIDTFYPGIAVDDLDLSGLTLEQAKVHFQNRLQDRAQSVALTVRIDDQEFALDAADIGFTDNSAAVLEHAYQIGRTSEWTEERARIDDLYRQVLQLKTQPLHLETAMTYDSARTADQITAFVETVQVTAQAAATTKFDPVTGTFTISDRIIGRKTDPVEVVAKVLEHLHRGHFQAVIAIESDKEIIGLTAAEIEAELGLLGSATTYAYKVDPPRDNNLARASEIMNGTLLQPGDVFSFNEVVGKRTAERGFMEAGVITDGTLVKDLGGGVCQVTTTVMQAAMMSDYELVERAPHSWPSSYTTIGLDATVDWNGPDFKFRNDSEFPVGIVAIYDKPKLTVKIYGRKLEDDLTISLRATRDETIPVEKPLYRPNDSLAPGQVVEIRAEHIGQRATAYKVYKKDGAIVREEVLFKSYYRPIQGIFELGPTPQIANPQPASSAAAGLTD